MPAKLLSRSFLTLSLPWFSLSHSLFLFVSPSLTVPHVCFSFSFISPTVSFSLPLSPSARLFIFLPLSPHSPLLPVCYLYLRYPLRAVLLRSAAVSSRRGARSGRGSHPRAAPNKAAFTKVPGPRLSEAPHLCEDLH